MAATTARLVLPYPSPSDNNNVPLDLQRLAAALDAVGVAYSQGTLGARPAAGTAGRFYAATDQTPAAIYYDTGAAWVLTNASLNSVLTAKGDVLAATAPGVPARVAVGTDGTSLVARATYGPGVGWEPVLGLPLALPGATAATRFAGGTVTGAPVTGAFAVGDLVTSQDGNQWVCTAAGTPGTFAQVSAPNSQAVQAASNPPYNAVSFTGASSSCSTNAPSVVVANPSSTRSMIVETIMEGFFSWKFSYSHFTYYEAISLLDILVNGVSVNPGVETRTQQVAFDYFRHSSNTYYTLLPPSGSATFQANAQSQMTGGDGQTQTTLTTKAYLSIQGWTI